MVGPPPEPEERPVVSAPTPPSVQKPLSAEHRRVIELVSNANTNCEYRYANDKWICVYCSHHASEDDITATGMPAVRACPVRTVIKGNGKDFVKKLAVRERRASAERERRKRKADQLAAIKEALRVPVAACLAATKEQERVRKAEERAVHPIHDRTGGGKELSGGDYLKEKLEDADAEQFGGRRVTPEGTGHRSDDTPDSSPDPWSSGAEEAAVRKPKNPIIEGGVFSVKLNDKDEKKSPAYECISHFFITMLPLRYQLRCIGCGATQDDAQTVSEEHFVCGQCGLKNGGDDLSYICHLCSDVVDGLRNAAHHMVSVHGDEALPTHDSRFGNVLRRWVKGGKKPPNLSKVGRKAGQTGHGVSC